MWTQMSLAIDKGTYVTSIRSRPGNKQRAYAAGHEQTVHTFQGDLRLKLRAIPRYVLLLLSYSCLAVSVVATLIYLFQNSTTIGWLVTMLYPETAPFLSVAVFASSVIIVRFSFMKNRRGVLVVSIVCAFIVMGTFAPYAGIPSETASADEQMLERYGSAFTSLDTSSMRTMPYSAFDSLYGVPIEQSTFDTEKDILYLDNGVDKFYFDWYRPVGEGPFPVIIAIHGGAWVIGNKGRGNVIPFNEYFASHGYAVFDIQYGLFDVTTLPEQQAAVFRTFAAIGSGFSPNYNGSYTIQQQIENVGYFTKMLELNSSAYAADMDNVFVVGRSAGGHLASLVTLGYRNPLYAGNFSAGMTVRGGIWFYPVTDLTSTGTGNLGTMLGGTLSPEEESKKLSASFLIGNSTVTPPIMLLHGNKDGLADYSRQGLAFFERAKSLGKACLLVTIPWAGHAFDLIFQSYGGQMSTYYIERFMALELAGEGA